MGWSGVFATLSALLSLAAFLYCYNAASAFRASVPKRIVDGFESLATRVLAAEERVALVESRMGAWRTEMDGLLEAVDGQLERIERKRRSAAAAASKIDRQQQQGNGPLSDAELLARAAAQGLL